MLDIGSSELLLIVIVAVLVIGPKDLPRAMYKLGQVLGKARGMARHFRTGVDAMIREAEMEELERKWAAENRRIMAENPMTENPGVDAGPSGPGISPARAVVHDPHAATRAAEERAAAARLNPAVADAAVPDVVVQPAPAPPAIGASGASGARPPGTPPEIADSAPFPPMAGDIAPEPLPPSSGNDGPGTIPEIAAASPSRMPDHSPRLPLDLPPARSPEHR